MQTHDFMPETVDDIYSNHLYCISWFYGGIFPFDSWEVSYDVTLTYCIDIRRAQTSVSLIGVVDLQKANHIQQTLKS